MVTVIETAFLAALVACVGGSARSRSARVTAARAIDLSAEVAPANEEDAPAKGTNQLKQRVFVFHPPCGQKETGR
jgi:hypothetical protein